MDIYRPPDEPRRRAFGGVARAAREAVGVQALDRWTFPWVSSLGSDFNFDFNFPFTEEQQCDGIVEYNYRRGGHAMNATPVLEPIARFVATC